MDIIHLLRGVTHPMVAEEWGPALQSAATYWGVDPAKYRWWLANLLHEAGAHLTNLEENLNYSSAARLMEVWPSRFKTVEQAEEYTYDPMKLANYVYSNRMGNGPPESNDGWTYRGRGLIQLTGRNNYLEYQKASKFPVLIEPSLLLVDRRISADAAAWYWVSRKLNDAPSFDAAVRVINGGLTGITNRRLWLRDLNEVTPPQVRYDNVAKLVLHDFSWGDVRALVTGLIKNEPVPLGSAVVTYRPAGASAKVDVRRVSKS